MKIFGREIGYVSDISMNFSISKKLLLSVVVTAAMLFSANLLNYAQINRMIDRMNSVYTSNVSLNELSDNIESVQNTLYRYLEVQSSDALTAYYRAEQNYRDLLDGLNDKITENRADILEKNIKSMSDYYLETTEKAVSNKRSLNVGGYRSAYEEAQKLYGYINRDITTLNVLRLDSNAASYSTLQSALGYLENMSYVLLIIAMLTGGFVMMAMIRDIVTPLSNLARTAKLVGEGNFYVKATPLQEKNEIGVMISTFNSMIDSIRGYIAKIKENAEKEQEMKERELLMQNHLKEARLKFLQSQINPHFLFNSLNAAMQLAAMEDAEKTSVFIEKMANFFRYNVKKSMENSTVEEEVKTVDNYIYILNVRFSGEIDYHSEVDKNMLSYSVPGMILQPIVENSVNHGLRDLERRGEILLRITDEGEFIRILIRDNGIGMTAEKIEEILSGKGRGANSDSTGIGINNVRSRLELYYGKEGIMRIESPGREMGTSVILDLPKERKSKDNVSDIDS